MSPHATSMRSFLDAAISALGDERMTIEERVVTAGAEIEGALMALDDAARWSASRVWVDRIEHTVPSAYRLIHDPALAPDASRDNT